MIKIALVDDHILLRNGLASVIKSFGGFKVIFQAGNGKSFIELLETDGIPDIVLLDITMPEMDGFETAKWINKNSPEIKVLVLTMMDNDISIIRMLKYGARGYLLKDCRPEILKQALQDVIKSGFYFNDAVSGKLYQLARQEEKEIALIESLSEKEIKFLQLCCSEKSYKEIAGIMNITPRAAEALRSTLFEKLDVPSRVGLVMFAIIKGLYQV